MHIGLIGGIGPAATEFYYRGLVARHSRSAKRMELTIVHADLRDLLQNGARGDAQAQARISLTLVRRLQAAGADAAAITSIGGHFCVQELAALSPIPILNIIPEIAARTRQQGYRTVGLLGTRRVMETRLYGGLGPVSVVVPQGNALDTVHQNYEAMARAGHATHEQRRDLFAIGHSMCRDQGADVVLLVASIG